MASGIIARIVRGRYATLVAVATLLFAFGCTSEGGSGGTGGNAATGGTGSAEGAASGQGVTDYLAYTGGKAGSADASLKPIAIGFINAQGGQQELPQATFGAEAAVKYINSELGGIGGHPLELHTCFIVQAEEEGQKCGQQLLSDPDVSVIVYGAVLVGNQALAATIDGKKPVVVGVAANPADSTAKNTYILYGDQTHVLGPWGTYARDVLKAKSAAIVFPSQAGANTAAEAAKKGMEEAGIQVKAVGYDPNATDLLGPLTAAGGQTADVIVPMTDIPGCSNLAKALQQIGSTKPVVSNPLCTVPPVAQALGGDLPNWTFGIAQVNAFDPESQEAKVYRDTIVKHGLKQEDVGHPYSALGWDLAIIVTKLMNAVGPDKITPETMSEQIKAFKGPLVMGAPTVECGKYPEAPAVCNDQTKFYHYKGKGTWESASGWLKPPA